VTTTTPVVDLLDPAFYAENPHETYRWMRANEPVYRDERNRVWGVTRHADVRDVELRSDVFVSGRGYRAVFMADETDMISLDDPRHRQQRRLVQAFFTPTAVKQHEARVQRIVNDLLDAVEDQGETEVVHDLAAQLPGRVVGELIGFGEDRWEDVKGWSERLMRIDMVERDQAAAYDFVGASMEIARVVLNDLLPARRAEPRDDLISVWANAEIDGRPLDPDTVFQEAGLFVAGGAETTRTVIAHGLRTMCDHPDDWERLAADPGVVPTAVDELIRWVTPLNNFFRVANEDTEIAGVAIAEGDRVALLYPSANRDEAVFDDPYRFDIARDPNPHLAFGFGTHRCIGAHLAALELRTLFGEMARRFTNLTPVTEPDVEPNIFARPVRSFRLAFDRR